MALKWLTGDIYPYKWSYGPLLITGDGAQLVQVFFFISVFFSMALLLRTVGFFCGKKHAPEFPDDFFGSPV